MPETDLAVVAALAEAYLRDRAAAPIAPLLAPDALAGWDFAHPLPLREVAERLFALLGQGTLRTDSPRYFGLFNPPATPESIAGDLIAATVNPQLAVWGHAPAAAEIERRLVRLFGGAIGWPETAGTFTSGGTEANHTAVLAALARRYPGWAERGLAAAHKQPVILVSAEAHLAWIKIARNVGLGSAAVRLVPAPDGLALDAASAARTLEAEPGCDPFLIVGTAGTTAHGAIDDLPGLAAWAQIGRAHV